MGLVGHVAKKYLGINPSDHEDLYSQLRYRLCRVIQTYDPAKGCTLGAFAVRSMEGEAKRFFRDERWLIRPPRDLRSNWSARVAAHEAGDPWAFDGESLEKLGSCNAPTPLHQLFSDADGNQDMVGDRVPDPSVDVEATVLATFTGRCRVRQLFSWLTPPERFGLLLLMRGQKKYRFQRRYRLNATQSAAAWVELLAKVRSAWTALAEGRPLPENPGSAVLLAREAVRAAARARAAEKAQAQALRAERRARRVVARGRVQEPETPVQEQEPV